MISEQHEMFDNAWREHCKEKQEIEEEQRDHLLKTIQWQMTKTLKRVGCPQLSRLIVQPPPCFLDRDFMEFKYTCPLLWKII